MVELLKAVLWGIVEGITEWLPISSTGHMILLDELIRLNVSESFKEMFLVVIQLGAIMAVVLLYFHKLNPFSPRKASSRAKKQLICGVKSLLEYCLQPFWAFCLMIGSMSICITM